MLTINNPEKLSGRLFSGRIEYATTTDTDYFFEVYTPRGDIHAELSICRTSLHRPFNNTIRYQIRVEYGHTTFDTTVTNDVLSDMDSFKNFLTRIGVLNALIEPC